MQGKQQVAWRGWTAVFCARGHRFCCWMLKFFWIPKWARRENGAFIRWKEIAEEVCFIWSILIPSLLFKNWHITVEDKSQVLASKLGDSRQNSSHFYSLESSGIYSLATWSKPNLLTLAFRRGHQRIVYQSARRVGLRGLITQIVPSWSKWWQALDGVLLSGKD